MLPLFPIAFSLAVVQGPSHPLPATQFLQLPDSPQGELSVTVQIPGRTAQVVLFPDDSRAPDFRVFRQVPGGLFPIPAPPSRTMTGYLQGEPGSLVSATLEDGKLTALIHDLDERSTLILEPVDPHQPRLRSRIEHRVRLFMGSSLACGCEPGAPGDHANSGDRVGQTPGVPAYSTSGLLSMDIVLDSTAELYAAFGGDETELTNYLLALEHHSSVLLEAQLGVRLEVVDLVLRPSNQAGGYPYLPDFQYSASNTEQVNQHIRNEWNFGWHPVYSHDYVHLFSDRGIPVSSTASIGGSQSQDICNTQSAIGRPTSWSAVSGASGFDADVEVLTHEIGHGWEIQHTSTGEGTTGLMAPVTNGEFFFSATDLNIAKTRIMDHGSCYDAVTPSHAPLVVQSATPTSVELLGQIPVVLQGSGLSTVYSIQFGSVQLDYNDFEIVSDNQLVISNLSGLDVGFQVGTVASLGGAATLAIDVLPVPSPVLQATDFAGFSVTLNSWGPAVGYNFNFLAFQPDTFLFMGSEVLTFRQDVNGAYLITDGQGYTTEEWNYFGSGLSGSDVWFQTATYDSDLNFLGVSNIESLQLGFW